MKETRVHESAEAEPESLSLVSGLLVFLPILLLGNEIGAFVRYPEFGSAVLFPPYAALAAVLAASPRRHWPWYVLAGTIAHTIAGLPHWSLSWIMLADFANIARALTAAVLLRWWFRGVPRLDSVPAFLMFVVIAVLVAPAVGASIGAANSALHASSRAYWRPWTEWFLSNALTALTMLPGFFAAIEILGARRQRRMSRRRVGEAALLGGALGVVCTIAFLMRSASNWDLALLLYGPLPLLIWSALRFGPGGASVALTVVALAATLGAGRHTGPFLSSSADDNVLTLQLFLLLTTVPVLCIAVVASARQAAVRLYRALLTSLQDHVAILDARGFVLEVNGSWRHFAHIRTSPCPFERVDTGDNFLAACREAVLLERADGDSNDAPRRALAGVATVLAGEQRRFEMEYEADHDGTHEWYTLRAEALERPEGGAVVTRADITARQQAQMEILEQRRELSHLARVAVLGQLSGAFAHELCQPLTSILSNAQAGQRMLRLPSIDVNEVTAILNDIVSDDLRAAQVINGLRAMLKRGEMRMQPVDTEELVAEVLRIAHAELLAKRVTAIARIDDELPPLLADRVQVQQVLLNLILNACDAMTDTPAAERIVVLTVRATETPHVLFSISDSGHGIPQALVDRLFEPFVTTKADGLGLGLSIARTIVGAHGGRIWVTNNTARGATVHCLFQATRVETGHNRVYATAGT